MGVAVLRREREEASVGRFTLHSQHLVRLDRFIAQARRRAARDGREFTGVAVEVDATGRVSVYAASGEPLVL